MKNTAIKILVFTFLFVIKGLSAQPILKVISSQIAFKIKNAGFTVNGTLSGLEAEIKFAPELLKTSFIKANIDANSINTGIESRDKHLKKEEFFNTSKYPKILIESSFFGKDGNKFNGYFKITLKGITKDITIPFTYLNGVLKGEFTIDRRDFKVGESSMIMSDKVNIQLTVNTLPKP